MMDAISPSHPADRTRVLLKGEYPDYIHASFVNVSATDRLWVITSVLCLVWYLLSRVTSRRRHSSLLRVRWSQHAGTSGRWSMTGGVGSLSCSPSFKTMGRLVGSIVAYRCSHFFSFLSLYTLSQLPPFVLYRKCAIGTGQMLMSRSLVKWK